MFALDGLRELSFFLSFAAFWNDCALKRAQALLMTLHFSVAHWQQLNI